MLMHEAQTVAKKRYFQKLLGHYCAVAWLGPICNESLKIVFHILLSRYTCIDALQHATVKNMG